MGEGEGDTADDKCSQWRRNLIHAGGGCSGGLVLFVSTDELWVEGGGRDPQIVSIPRRLLVHELAEERLFFA